MRRQYVKRMKQIAPLAAVGGSVAALALFWMIARRPALRVACEPRKPVDLTRYLGRWYELGRYDQSFETGCEHVTAEYYERVDGLIEVINTCRDLQGRVRRIAQGRARPVADSQGTKLKVSFFGPFFVGDYWILDHADDYAWSIVGDPTGRFLWILGREPDPPEQLYQELLARARGLGYDLSRFRRTQQQSVA
jgi:apolipoprotein D and lipocalin family protein